MSTLNTYKRTPDLSSSTWYKGILNNKMARTEDRMNAPAERMEVPTDANVVTYANADITDTIEIFERYGLRFLTADEIRTEMPRYLTHRSVMCGG